MRAPAEVWVRTYPAATGRRCWEFLPPGPGARPVVLAGFGEMAMALHLAEQPLRRDMTLTEVAALIVRGTEVAGLDGIRELLDLSGRIHRRWQGRTAVTAADRAERREVWAGPRQGLCYELAHRVGGGWSLPGERLTVTGGRFLEEVA
ncbi:MAG: hypothetical protein ACR2GH_07195 [Pseudonocardia sp.]